MDEDLYSKLRKEIWNTCYNCSSMRYIYEKRGSNIRFNINLLKYWGIVVPVVIGGVAISYGVDSSLLKYSIPVGVFFMLIQLVISISAIVYNWDGELSYSYEAIQSYNQLYRKYKDLANYPPTTFEILKDQSDKLNSELNAREQQDTLHKVKEWEERMGMKYSLREHQIACVECAVIPRSMGSTECPVCGNYKLKNRLFNN